VDHTIFVPFSSSSTLSGYVWYKGTLSTPLNPFSESVRRDAEVLTSQGGRVPSLEDFSRGLPFVSQSRHPGERLRQILRFRDFSYLVLRFLL